MEHQVRYPSSRSQQAVWLSSQIYSGSPLFNLLWQVTIQGPLDIGALQRSLQMIVDRYEVLRTSFAEENGQLVQIVASRLPVECPVICFPKSAVNNRSSRLEELSWEFGLAPFDLENGPLVRFCVISLGADDHRLFVALHHLVFDGGSWPVFFNELVLAYTGEPIAPVSIQYRDYVIWQNSMLESNAWADSELYWKKLLAEETSGLDLPTDYPRPLMRSLRGAVCAHLLSAKLMASLRAVSRRCNSSLFKTLLAAFYILLQKHTGEEDFIVRTTLTGRALQEVMQGIGFYVNTAMLRTQFDGDPSFMDVLSQVHKVLDAAVMHQAYPFDEAIRHVKPVRQRSRSSATTVNFTKMPASLKRRVGDLVFSDSRVFLEAGPLDLGVYSQETPEGVLLTCVYSTDLFERATINRLLGHYQTLLEHIVTNPECPISNYRLVKAEEIRDLASRRNLVQPTLPFVDFPKQEIEQSITARFEFQVKQFPHKLAVKTRTQQWTYSELNNKAGDITAAIMRLLNATPQRIGLVFGHGAPMIAGILGVLKSGATYVPLAPSQPRDRLTHVLEDSQATALVTDSENVDLARRLTHGDLPIINIDEVKSSSLPHTIATVSPDVLAYILYTSGSTGTPKGVVQNHRNVLHHIRTYTNSLHLNATDRLSLFSHYSFDAAVMDIFGALLNGGTLYPCDVRNEDSEDLINWLADERITVYHSTPTLFRHLFARGAGQKGLTAIRMVVLGGEPALAADVALFKQYFSRDALLVNGLGPTESTLALQYFIDHNTEITTDVVKVGYSVEGTEILLLDDAGEPGDLHGEVAIKSSHMALGYWRRPDLTAKAFRVDPDGESKRIYRTGDIGRRFVDGSIGFCGRKDFQVKIRGFRIELGEIEAVLAQHPAVRESVVVTKEDNVGDKRLIAYIVPQKSALAASELRAYLHAKLPDYMVPSTLVVLESLPVTPNGKVDRKALPSPDRNSTDLEQAYVAPRNSVEEIIAGIWAETLGIKRIGVHDNFFDLGGHSLKATQVISRLRKVFRSEMPLRHLFEYPTIAELTAAIDSKTIEEITGEKLEQLLNVLESMSDEAAQSLLADPHVTDRET